MLMKKKISSTTIVFAGKNAITLVNLDVILFFWSLFHGQKWNNKNTRSKAGDFHMKVTRCFSRQRFVRKDTFWNWPISTASKRCPNPCEQCKKHGDDRMVKCRKNKTSNFIHAFDEGGFSWSMDDRHPKGLFHATCGGVQSWYNHPFDLNFGVNDPQYPFSVDLNMMHNTWNTLYNRPFKFVWNMTYNDPCYFRSFWF